jgi:methylase of polypeptide subunit release factors
MKGKGNMMTQKRKYPKFIKIYFPSPGDEDLYNTLKKIADNSRLSMSMLGFLLLEHGLPQVEDALKVFQSHRKVVTKRKHQ